MLWVKSAKTCPPSSFAAALSLLGGTKGRKAKMREKIMRVSTITVGTGTLPAPNLANSASNFLL